MPAQDQSRPATAAFQERVFEVRATGEEVVLSKETRIYEEIVIRKLVGDRVETVRAVLRETRADVEDSTGERAPKPAPPR